MPLQIRRGTEAERTAMTQPLAQGELLYVTNDQRLYIGNGSTLGGVQITGYTNEDAQDAAAQIFSNGSHTGITFTYNDTSASLSAALDLSNFSGTIRADAFKGSVFGDDSTPMVDAINNTFNGSLSGNVTGNLSGNVIGNVTGNVTGSVTGDVIGSIFADDSTLLVDAVGGRLVGPLATTGLAGNLNTTGFQIVANTNEDVTLTSTGTGNINLNGTLVNNNGDITTVSGGLNISPNGLTQIGNSVTNGRLRVVTNSFSATQPICDFRQFHNSQEAVNINYLRYRGTSSSPSNVQLNDNIINFGFAGFFNGDLRTSAGFGVKVDETPSGVSVPGKFQFINHNLTVTAELSSGGIFKCDEFGALTNTTINFNNSISGDLIGSVFADDSTMIIDGTEGGKITTPAVTLTEFLKLPVYADDTARTASISAPVQGMVIFMRSGVTPAATNQPQYFDGANWVNI